MLNVFAAETMKLRRHKATWFLVWGYPIGCIVILLLATFIGLARGHPAAKPPSADNWIRVTTFIWNLAGGTNGRFLLASFVAVVFAGEYGWNTWKLIVPHRARNTLIAGKYVVVFGLLLLAYTLTAAITTAGLWASDKVTGDVIPAGVTASGLFKAHAMAALTVLCPALVTMAYTTVAAVLTRSTIAALIIGIVATTLEQIIANAAPILSLQFPALASTISGLFHVLPGYHLANLSNWINKGMALAVKFPPKGETVALSWQVSLAVIAVWVVPLVAATFAIFRRQDIN